VIHREAFGALSRDGALPKFRRVRPRTGSVHAHEVLPCNDGPHQKNRDVTAAGTQAWPGTAAESLLHDEIGADDTSGRACSVRRPRRRPVRADPYRERSACNTLAVSVYGNVRDSWIGRRGLQRINVQCQIESASLRTLCHPSQRFCPTIPPLGTLHRHQSARPRTMSAQAPEVLMTHAASRAFGSKFCALLIDRQCMVRMPHVRAEVCIMEGVAEDGRRRSC